MSKSPLTPDGVLADIGYGGFVRSLFNRSGDLSKDLAHAILGIATETHELRRAEDRVHGLEELGDLEFYGEAALQVIEDAIGLALERDELVFALDDISALICDDYSAADAVADGINDLLDVAKRWVGYGKAPADFLQLARDVMGLVRFINAMSAYYEPDLAKVRRTNVAKLLKRYEGIAFNAERAVNRDTAAERTLLEQHAA
jgi:hypothetical protein